MLDPWRHMNMNGFYKNRKTKWENNDDEPAKKERRTTNQLLLFCDLILTYEKYKPYNEEMNNSAYSPSGSERSADSFSSESESNCSFNNNESASEDTKNDYTDTEDDSWNLITCYCMKPFANRPMIECSVCRTWLHMSCAIIRSNNIPEHFVCQICREAKGSRRRSQRIRNTDRRFPHA